MLIEFLGSLLLHCLDLLKRKRCIPNRDHDATYIERYYLLFNRDHESWLPNLYLHHICLSDAPILHDHPWHWASLILKGGYWETTPKGRFWRSAGSFRRGHRLDQHFLTLDREKAGGETWTLFFVGRRVREWGFIDAEGNWTQWQEHLYGEILAEANDLDPPKASPSTISSPRS